jgi:hypothetical protein
MKNLRHALISVGIGAAAAPLAGGLYAETHRAPDHP